jgi:hypothetical protein
LFVFIKNEFFGWIFLFLQLRVLWLLGCSLTLFLHQDLRLGLDEQLHHILNVIGSVVDEQHDALLALLEEGFVSLIG